MDDLHLKNDDMDEALETAEPLSLVPFDVECPYCWQTIEIYVDPTQGDHVYTEDCSVCCRPIQVHVMPDFAGWLGVEVRREDLSDG